METKESVTWLCYFKSGCRAATKSEHAGYIHNKRSKKTAISYGVQVSDTTCPVYGNDAAMKCNAHKIMNFSILQYRKEFIDKAMPIELAVH